MKFKTENETKKKPRMNQKRSKKTNFLTILTLFTDELHYQMCKNDKIRRKRTSGDTGVLPL